MSLNMCPKTGKEHKLVRRCEPWYRVATWDMIQTYEGNLKYVEFLCYDCSFIKKVGVNELSGNTGLLGRIFRSFIEKL